MMHEERSEKIQSMADKVDDIKQMRGTAVDFDDFDIDHISGEGVMVYIEVDDWYRTNYKPSIYERLNYLLNEHGDGWLMSGMDILHKEKEEDADWVVARVLLSPAGESDE